MSGFIFEVRYSITANLGQGSYSTERIEVARTMGEDETPHEAILACQEAIIAESPKRCGHVIEALRTEKASVDGEERVDVRVRK